MALSPRHAEAGSMTDKQAVAAVIDLVERGVPREAAIERVVLAWRTGQRSVT